MALQHKYRKESGKAFAAALADLRVSRETCRATAIRHNSSCHPPEPPTVA